VMTPNARYGLKESSLGRVLRWKPQTQLGVWALAVTCGAIWFAGQLAYPVWPLTTRAILALALVALAVVRGNMRLRRRAADRQWSASHPISLTASRQSPAPDCDHLAPPDSTALNRAQGYGELGSGLGRNRP
jgi:hypothetical protein